MPKYIIICIIFLFSSIYAKSQTDIKKLNIAVLVYEGVYLLDFAGPAEVFSDTYINDTTRAFNVYTVSLNTEKIATHTGLKVSPDFSFGTCPIPDILIVPGGNPTYVNKNKLIIDWIFETSKNCKHVMSVCTGAFILGKTGLLDNQEATTWHGALEKLKKSYPKSKVVSGKRWTDNGKILTTAGVSAGIDGSLFLVSKLLGKEAAKMTAEYMDYEYWK